MSEPENPIPDQSAAIDLPEELLRGKNTEAPVTEPQPTPAEKTDARENHHVEGD